MSEVTQYRPGTFCWAELCTTDGPAAKKFYTNLFGWTFADKPISEDMVYSMLKLKDKHVAALYQQDAKQKERGVPAHWISYISVANVDETAAKVKSLGGALIDEPFDVFDVGQMAIIQDPTGAVFAIWQPKAHFGAAIINEPGAVCWNELLTRDTKEATDFYTQVFGWESKTDASDFPYTEFLDGNEPRGGMIQISPDWDDVPPNWMVYFAVDDCDDSIKQAQNLGAQILVPAKDIPEVGRFACLMDPQGAAFSIIKLNLPV